MSTKLMVAAFLLCAGVFGSGCKTLSVYDTEFQCNQRPDGKCESIEDSHKASIMRSSFRGAEPQSYYMDGYDGGGTSCTNPWGTGCGKMSPFIKPSPDQPTIFKKMKGDTIPDAEKVLLGEGADPRSHAPIRNPGVVLRLYLYDYVAADGVLYSDRYIFFEAKPPVWDLDAVREAGE